jgi:tetratricopeptide (TPR) repeat protein
MKGLGPIALLALIVVAAEGAAAQAQPAAAACSIDDGKPGQVKDARNAVMVAENIGKPEDRMKSLTGSINKLTKDQEKIDKANALGRQLVMGSVLVALSQQPGMDGIVSRASAGYATNPEGTIDLALAADSAFDAVEAAQPGCKAQTEPFRRRLYGAYANGAVNAYNARQIDSAEYLARRSLAVYDGFPLAYIAYNVLGNILQGKDDMPGAIQAFQKMAELMKGDTSTVDERKQTIMNVSELMYAQAELKEGEAKTAAMKEIVTWVDAFSKEFPEDPRGKAALARAQIGAGDSAAAKAVFSEIVSKSDGYTDSQLFEVGVIAARAEQNEAAGSLFDAGLKKNPYSRDGLFNVAATYSRTDQWDKMPPILTRLIEVDPENPDNYQLWALYYQGKSRAAKAAAEKKPAGDPAVVAYQQINDSLVKYFTRYQEAPVRVSFTLFSRDGAKRVLAGSVENRTDAEKSYALKIEFLDATGQVLATKDAPVEAVPAKGQKSFRVEVENVEQAVAFRYGKLTN